MKNYLTSCTLYVSAKTGNDNFSGLSPVVEGLNDGPVASIGRALGIIGELRFDGVYQPYTIKLMDETMELSAPLRISPRVDARHCERTPSNFTVEPYGDGVATIVGGRRIGGFREDSFMGVACLSAEVPEVKDGGWDFTDLYVNGDRAESTRYPAEGFFTPEDVENHGRDLMSSSDWFIAREGDIPDGIDLRGAIISFGHYWIDEHSPIASYDPETRRVTLSSATRFTIAPEAGASARMDYYIENLAIAFRNPGEWYLDRTEGKVYYIPKNEKETADSLEVYAPTVRHILNVCGTPEDPADGVRFRRIRFTCTKGEYESIGFPRTHGVTASAGSGAGKFIAGKAYASDLQACSDVHGAIQMTYAHNFVFEKCEFVALGTHGLSMDDGCVGNRIEDCHFRCLGAGAIRISGALAGEDAIGETHHNVVTNCHLEDGGRRYFSACGVAIIHAHHNEVSHCTIHDFYYSGISCGFIWGYHATNTHHNDLSYNHIYALGKGRLSDMGGIYMLGPQHGSVIRGNVIHDVRSKVYGGWALYTDEGSSYIVIEDNICYDCTSNCYHQHYGQQNVLRNNIFAFSGGALLIQGRREAHLGLILENNIFYSDGTAYMSNLLPAMLSSDRNLFYCTKGDAPYMVSNREDGEVSFADRALLGADGNSVYADPLFVNAEGRDFTLSPSSPAIALGFRPLDASRAGCRLD